MLAPQIIAHHFARFAFMSDGGLSISYGDQKQTNIQTSTDVSHTASNIGSLNGNVSIKAGKDYTQTGSNNARGQVYLNSVHLKVPDIMDYLKNLLYP